MIKRGLSLEEAFKALNGRLDLTSRSKDIKRKKTMTESVSDFPKLAELTRGNVFTAYFGNHESCDFSYNPTTAILTQTYYDPKDVFTYRNIKTQTDFENVVRNNLGDVIITWERKEDFLTSDWENVLSKVKAGKFMQVILDDFDDMYLGIINSTFYAFLHDGDIESCSANTDIEKFFSKTFLESTDGYETFEKAIEIPYKEFKEALDFLKEE